MLFILILFRALLAAGVQTLTIDSQLGTSIEDCFERISIGERIPTDAVYRNVSELTTKECEQICKQDKQCQSYDYGVGAKGNATCDLGKVDEKEIKEKNILQRHPDYDVYVRRFQCEQSPPTPMQIVMDDPDGNPENSNPEGPNTPNGHRPVFRPEDEHVPPSDDYLISSNLQYRPDDHYNKPNIDESPSYGDRRPQDLSYKPQRPGYKPDPHDEINFQGYNKPEHHKPDPYGIDKPDYNYIIRPNRRPYNIRPDPYGPNHDSGPIGPLDGPYRPNRPYDKPNNYHGENDVHVEIYDPPYGSHVRPNSESNYAQGINHNRYGSQNYGEHRPDPVNEPTRPDIPGYGHLGAGYASEHGYGLYKPSKPAEPYKPGQSGYGNQGSYNSNHASYGSSQSDITSSQENYGSNQATYGSKRPYDHNSGYTKPQKPDEPYKKPAYSNQPSYNSNQASYSSHQQSYGNNQNHYSSNTNYGSIRPGNDNADNYNKPLYGNDHGLYGNHNNLYGDYGSNHGLYASSHGAYNQAYGTNQGLYDNNGYGSGTYGTSQSNYDSSQQNYGTSQSSYGSYASYSDRPYNKPTHGGERPSYGNEKPTYGVDRPSYSDRPVYQSNSPAYGSERPGYDSERPNYISEKPNYGNDKPAYGSQKPAYVPDRPSYGSTPSYINDKPGYGSESPSYGSERPSYSSDRPYLAEKPVYGTERPSYSNEKPGYGNDKPSYGTERPSYGSQKPSYGSEPLYGNEKPSYGNDKPSYASEKPSYSPDPYGSEPSYGSVKPSYSNDKPSYGNDRPSYGSERPSYGPEKPLYGIEPSYGNDKPSYSNESPSYVSQKPSYAPEKPTYGSEPSYDSVKPSYGNDKPSYGNDRPSYSNDRPSYGSEKPPYGNDPSYGNDKPSYGNESPIHVSQKPSYAPEKPTYGSEPSYDSVKPSYGNDKPSYGNDRPSYGNDRPSYGSEKPPYGNKPSYDNDNPLYGNENPSYGSQKPTYGSEPSYVSVKPSYGNDKPYGNDRPSYGSDRPSYGSEKPPYGNEPSYGNDKPYGSYRPGYGNEQQIYGHKRPSYGDKNYGNDRYGSYGNQGSYGNIAYDHSHASYGTNQASHISNQVSYGSNQVSHGGNQEKYGNNQAGYGSSQTAYDSYGSNQANYGSNQANYDSSHASYGNNGVSHNNKRPSYGNNEETYGSSPTNYGSSQASYATNKPSFSNRPSYTTNQPSYGSQEPAENLNETGYPDIKPVYEYDSRPDGPIYMTRPNGDVVTSRPMAIGDFGDRADNRAPGKTNYEACFRRVLAGRRALRSFVQKAVPCESLESCRRECATERRFPCESFNYRIDNSFRGRGLCELMTKPIEAFDLRRDFVDDKDFDFYELDRNSLEPNCPDTLRGPGMLHSGFLTSKPDRQGSGQVTGQWDRSSDWDRDNKRHFDDRYSDRRHDDRHFVPYQIGMSRSNEDHSQWGQYGGSYGGYDTYYKDREDYHNSVNHWKISEPDRQYGVRPLSDSNFDYHSLAKTEDLWKDNRYGHGSWKRGRWNSSGASWNGLEHDESNFHQHNRLEDIGRSDEPAAKDCSSRRRPGMSLGSGAIRRSIFARNVVDCETACFGEREFKCVSYSYRYSNSHGSDNCFLSERPYRGLELSTDSGSDVYAMPQDKDCATINHKPWVESECFWHVRSGAAVSGGVVRAALTVTGLGACEAECIRAQGFFCRGFSFRFDSPVIGDELDNCILTSSPPTSLESGRGLRPNVGHELYSRGNYGRGCEPALYDDSQHIETQCYLQYDNSARLTPSATRGQAHAKDEMSCGQACTDAPFRCLSFSYNNNAPPETDNCLLSEIRLFDLKEGVDYVHSTDDWLFAFDLFNGQCWRKVHGEEDYEEPSPELPRPIPISGPGSDVPFLIPGPPGPPSGPSGPTGPSGIGYLPETPDHFIPSGPPEPYKPEYLETRPGFRPGHASDPVHYKPYSSKPDYPSEDFKPIHAEPSRPGYHNRPDHSMYLNQKPYYPPDSDFKPGFPEIDYKPALSSETDYSPGYRPGSNYKPNYQPIEPGLKPNYPSNSGFKLNFAPDYVKPADYKPTYPLRPQQPDNYRPGYLSDNKPIYRPRPEDLDNFKPGYGPENYKPSHSTRPQQTDDYRPGYPGDNKPVYRPRPPELDKFKPAYGSENYKPTYPTRPQQPDNYRPGYSGNNKPLYGPRPEDQLNFKPGYQGDRKPVYPTPLPEPIRPYQPAPKPSFNPDYQQRPFRPVESKPVNDRPGPYIDRKPVKPVSHGDREDNELTSVSWRHYTVSGFPCRSGTSCGQNVIAGHWACEPEGGEIGSWDYCCAPTHRCGYSEGFHKPWCYVGPSEDQWRPCSEKYYPYHQHKVPHPSQGQRDSRPLSSEDRVPSYIPDRSSPPYISVADRKYWDDLYRNGPQAYYDKHGDPLPGYSRVPTADRPRVKYQHNYPQPGSGNWVQVPAIQSEGQPVPGGLGVPRYWPVAYLHKGPPPNMTYFRYNETTTTERTPQYIPSNRELPDSTPSSIDNGTTEKEYGINFSSTDKNYADSSTDSINNQQDRNHHGMENDEKIKNNDYTTERNHRYDKKRNITDFDVNNIKNDVNTTTEKVLLETTEKIIEASNVSDVESSREDVIIDKDIDSIKGIDDKLEDFSSIEVVDLDTKSLKTIEEEKQIEEIGRLLASRRGGKIILEKRAQKDLESKKIALGKDLMEFNLGNRFPTTERRGIIQKVTKEEINRDRKEFQTDRYSDKSLEVSETTYVRPPRVLSTTDNIRRAVVNGKVFYEASVREQRDLFNATKRNKSLNPVYEKERPINHMFGKKVFNRNVNPVRRVRRVFKKRYNPDEVRRRLLERERSMKGIETARKV